MTINYAELQAALDGVQAEWNKAEEYLKKVERLRRGLVVGASINELRYAGRMLVDSYAQLKANDPPVLCEETKTKLSEVKKFCIRAQHDAMDATLSYVDSALLEYENRFGKPFLNKNFKNYLSLRKLIKEIGEVMSKSRGDREARGPYYEEIKEETITTLVDLHYELELSQDILDEAYTAEVKKDKKNTFFQIGLGIILLIFSLALGPIVSDAKEKYFPKNADGKKSSSNTITLERNKDKTNAER